MHFGNGAYSGVVGKPEVKSHLKDLAVDGYNIKMDIKEVDGVVDWIHLAKDRNMWRAIVNTVMNLGFHKMRGIP